MRSKMFDRASGVTSVSEEVMAIGPDGNDYDEVTGSWLDPELVKRARREELEEVRKHTPLFHNKMPVLFAETLAKSYSVCVD